MNNEEIKHLVVEALEEVKAFDITVLDVRQLTDVADYMIFASGGSDRQVKAIAGKVVEMSKANGLQPLGVEGEADGQWVLIDLVDVVVHVMLPPVRDFYQIEKIWSGQESVTVPES